VSGLQVLKKSYAAPGHAKKILRSLPPRFIQKFTVKQEAKDLNKLSLKNLISSLKNHEIEIESDKPNNLSKSVALTSKEKTTKSLKLPTQKRRTQVMDLMLM